MNNKMTARDCLNKVEERYEKKYTNPQMIAYLKLYEKIKNVKWETVQEYSISVDGMKRILELYLNKNERYFITEYFGLDTGKSRNCVSLQQELELPYSVIQASLKDAIQKLQDLIVLNYISRDLKNGLKDLNKKMNIFELPNLVRRPLIRLNIDIPELVKMKAEEVEMNRTIGKKKVKYIREYFASKGIKW